MLLWISEYIWLVFFSLSACISLFYIYFSTKKNFSKCEQKIVIKNFIFSYILGYLGARLGGELIDNNLPLEQVVFLNLFIPGAMSYMPGAAFSLLCSYVYLKKKRVSLLLVLDTILPAVLLASAIGKIGCFFNHDDVGLFLDRGSLLFEILNFFTDSTISKLRYPVQVFESLALIFSFIFITFFIKKYLYFPGATGAMCVVCYSLQRFLFAYLRQENSVWQGEGSVSIYQVMALCYIFLASLFIFIWSLRCE
jgi:prolipoprotein diacylglyceryltransferase